MSYTLDQVILFTNQYYSFTGKLKPLMGEEDYNYFLQTDMGDKYLVKISRPGSSLAFINFQNQLIVHLAKSDFFLKLPEIVVSKNGSKAIDLGEGSFIRVQHWVPGRMLDEANPKLAPLFESRGSAAGLLSKYLQDFDHEEAHRFYKWNPSETLHSKKYFDYFQSEQEKVIGLYFWNLFEINALPHLDGLRKSVNYNDAHGHNLLINSDIKSPQVSGVIDFGDAIYTQTVNELAIACAYAGMNQPDPI